MRTTIDAVEGLIDVDSGDDLTPFIESANALVTDVCAPLGYDDARLELIERWLSAHFYAVSEGVISNEKADEVSQAYQYKVEMYLDFTKYGQQAMVLDTLGGLAGLMESIKKPGAKRGAAWLGTKRC